MTYVLVFELREHQDLAVHAARRRRRCERVRHLLERHPAAVARVRHRPKVRADSVSVSVSESESVQQTSTSMRRLELFVDVEYS